MASHWDWVDEQRELNKTRLAPQNGQPLQFTAGDRVRYTQPELEHPNPEVFTITGLVPEGHEQFDTGARYYLDWDCHWFGVAEITLQKAEDNQQ